MIYTAFFYVSTIGKHGMDFAENFSSDSDPPTVVEEARQLYPTFELTDVWWNQVEVNPKTKISAAINGGLWTKEMGFVRKADLHYNNKID